ncbi:MAG TPA: hypothetical protein VLJ38_15455 [Polyangiaceae bacterium]|nr:hypothetical protein [Polyangiaceae bacterium]
MVLLAGAREEHHLLWQSEFEAAARDLGNVRLGVLKDDVLAESY